MADDLLAIADELYSLPLPEFTPHRDTRARELKGTPLAATVKRLRKPATAAWVVNLLVRHETEQVEQVLEVGAALREAQAAMSADQLRELTRQRRQLTAAVTTRARALAREHGLKVSDDVAEQVQATLTAAMVDEQCSAAVRSGLLVSPLAATGVDEVPVAEAVAVPEALGFAATPRAAAPAPRPDLKVVPDPDADAKALAEAEERLAEAEEMLAEARHDLDAAATDVDTLRARELQLQSEIEELKRRLADLEESLDEVDEELSDAEEVRSEAEDAVREATRERDAAAAAVARLRG